jgi:hypothetical protein
LIDEEVIAAAVAGPPDDWPFTLDERIETAAFLATRRDSLLVTCGV